MNDVSHDDTSPEVGWGTPTPTPQPRPGHATAWTTLRRVLFWALVAIGALAAGSGLVMVLADLSDTTDDWHGLGVAIGLMAAGPGLVLCTLAGLGLRAVRRSGRAGGRAHAVVAGFLLLGTMIFGFESPLTLVPAGLGALLLLSVLADRDPRP